MGNFMTGTGVTEVTDEQLRSIAELSLELVDAAAEVKRIEEMLAKAKEKFRRYSEEIVPTAMKEIGLTEYTMLDGSKVTLDHELYASITNANKPAAHEWLREHGHASLIKHEVSCSFGKGETLLANQFMEMLDTEGYKYKNKEQVHWQTLRAFVKEQIADGKELPADLFGIHTVDRAKVSDGR